MGQIFTQDFGVQPHFMIKKALDPYDDYGEHLAKLQAKAFLMLPMLPVPISTGAIGRTVHFFLCHHFDLSMLILNEDQAKKFENAMKTLSLQPYVPDEDDSIDQNRSSANQGSGDGKKKSLVPPSGVGERTREGRDSMAIAQRQEK